jgi:hypothetical protein
MNTLSKLSATAGMLIAFIGVPVTSSAVELLHQYTPPPRIETPRIEPRDFHTPTLIEPKLNEISPGIDVAPAQRELESVAPAPATRAPVTSAPSPGVTNTVESAPLISMKVRARNSYEYQAQIAFFAENRQGYYWGAYTLDDDDMHEITLNCYAGEKICYGAWEKGLSSPYWGVGPYNSHACTKCCWSCGGIIDLDDIE